MSSKPDLGQREHLPDYDPMVMEAFAEGRHADDIYVVFCSCGWWSYWNEGSHATCRNCGSDITACIEDSAMTVADYWMDSPYPCDARPNMANEKVQRLGEHWVDQVPCTIHPAKTKMIGLRNDPEGAYCYFADHAARVQELLEALRAYRHPDPDGEGHFHDECFKDDSRNIDTRCDLCKRADALLK